MRNRTCWVDRRHYRRSNYFPNSTTVAIDDGDMVVNPTASFHFATGTPNTTATVSNNQIDISFSSSTGYFYPEQFSGVVLTDLTHSLIEDVKIDASSTLAGFTASDLSFTTNKIFINFGRHYSLKSQRRVGSGRADGRCSRAGLTRVARHWSSGVRLFRLAQAQSWRDLRVELLQPMLDTAMR